VRVREGWLIAAAATSLALAASLLWGAGPSASVTDASQQVLATPPAAAFERADQQVGARASDRTTAADRGGRGADRKRGGDGKRTGNGNGGGTRDGKPRPQVDIAPALAPGERANVVFILMDDFSAELLQQMPEAMRMKEQSAYFTNAFVADSLCCSSRAVTLTGMYPHNNGVSTNSTGADPANPEGGFPAFQARRNGTRTFAYSMNNRGAGYRTIFSGKYLNEYRPSSGDPAQPGWDEWNVVGGGGYRGWDYNMFQVKNRAGSRVLGRTYYGLEDEAYLTDVLRRNAVEEIADAELQSEPYVFEIAPFSTHARSPGPAHYDDPLFPPAPRDRPANGGETGGNCGTTPCSMLNIEDLSGYNDDQFDNRPIYPDGTVATRWHRNREFDAERTARFTTYYRDRARMAQSLDQLLAKVRAAVGPKTYVVLTSDNGLHLGQHRLTMGKGTAYGHDVGVPLLVSGPGVRPGPRDQMVSNVDLAPTFETMAGLTPTADRDGGSLLPMLRDADAPGPRFVFIEHTRPTPAADDPDNEVGTELVPSYIAVRSKDALLVRYDLERSPDAVDYAYEFYRGLAEPGAFEETNTYDIADPLVQLMTERLLQFSSCHEAQCRVAAR